MNNTHHISKLYKEKSTVQCPGHKCTQFNSIFQRAKHHVQVDMIAQLSK